MGAIIQWLFTDPTTAGGANGTETFHFYIPWIIFLVLGALVPFYYWTEARKRFFKKNVLNKRLMDKYMNRWAVITIVGVPLLLSRWLLDSTPLSWRIWRYAWALWSSSSWLACSSISSSNIPMSARIICVTRVCSNTSPSRAKPKASHAKLKQVAASTPKRSCTRRGPGFLGGTQGLFLYVPASKRITSSLRESG